MREWLTTALDVLVIALSVVACVAVGMRFGVAGGAAFGAIACGTWSFVITRLDTRRKDGDA